MLIRKSSNTLWGAALFFLLVAAAPAVATAADSEDVEALIRQGVELRQQGKDERALPLFQRAFQLVESPRTAGQLGLAEMAVGYWLEAERHLALALEVPDHPWVAKNRRTLEQSLASAKTNVGEVVIEGSPPGAAVEVNGRPAGVLPLPSPVRVSKGKVRVDVNAPGHTPTSRTLAMTGGDRQHVSVALEKIAVVADKPATVTTTVASTTATSPSTSTSSTSASTPEAVVSTPPSAPADDGFTTGQTVGLVLGIAAGAALIGAAVETVIWQSKRSDFNGPGAGSGKCYQDQDHKGAPGCEDLYNSLHQAQTFALIGYAATAALGGAAAIVFLSSKKPASESRVACAPVFGAPGVTCRLQF